MKIMLSILALFLILPNLSSAQSLTSGDKLWLSAYFDLQNEKMKVEERIKEIDLKIAQNEQEIRQINELLAKIQETLIIGTEKQKEDAQKAKPVAEKALMQAKETQKKLKDQKMKYEWLMSRLNEEERSLKDLYSKMASNNNIAGLVKECSGTVRIMNLQTKKLEDACHSFMPINDRDEITTSSDGRIELKILDGRGNFIVGPDSEVIVKKKSVDEEGVEFIQGKVYTKVDKSDEYLQKVKGYIERYKEDLKTIKGWAEEKLKKFSIETCRLLWGPNSCSRPEWVIGIRGTEFTIEREGADTVKISVMEGSVEVTHNINNSKNESYEIPEGYEAIINGETLTKRKIEKLEKWWEK
jgi:uncharacterized coiled-coil protein SlyX